ncbi:DJ-1 family glyoxalase III [Lachnoclostridium sp. Marseille-P6806]|uniref:DJ-1 family glyoxalase III n=1 Tax=Lachnoclostridium sp. Marseille-P6806 TaxID=2364793 RepID=UPI00102F762E|nr:DJ-1 family glyoxalase III [Lachnoclostridium sp. Marseille-P6806]
MSDFHQKTDKKTAVFLADGSEEIEALTVVDLLYRAGIPVQTVSVNKTPEVLSSHGVRIIADTTVDRLNFDELDMLVLPGGMPGTTNLQNCETLIRELRRFFAEGRRISAICAAPTILAGLGMLEGKHATCFPGQESNMAGAVLTREPATQDGNIITGRGMGCSIPFALKIVSHYLGSEAADTLAAQIVYTPGRASAS